MRSNLLLPRVLMMLFIIAGVAAVIILSDARVAGQQGSVSDSIMLNLEQEGLLDKELLQRHACFHLAKGLVEKEAPTFENQIYLSQVARESGWYDQAYGYAKASISLAANRQQKAAALMMLWLCDLSAMDTVRAVKTLASLNQYSEQLETPALKLKYAVHLGYHYHNLADYRKALDYYRAAMAINPMRSREDSLLLGSTYHKAGNSFNDILRIKLTHLWPRREAYDSARHYYRKALEVNQPLLPRVHPRVGITYLTLGILENANGNFRTAEKNYMEAFRHLTLNRFNINPAYTSIALSQLSGVYYLMYEKWGSKAYLNKAVHYASLNNEFLKEELVTYHTNAGRENLVKYIRQISFLQMAAMEGSKYGEGIFKINPLLVEISTQNKYASTIKSSLLSHKAKAESRDEALRMISEAGFITALKGKEKLSKTFSFWKERVTAENGRSGFLNNLIDTAAIQAYCKANKAVVLDYYLISDKLFINRFSESGSALIVRKYHEGDLNDSLPVRLYRYMVQDRVDSFRQLSYRCYSTLLKEVVPEGCKQVVIIPDRYLSLLPWGALLTGKGEGVTWKGLPYAIHQFQFNQVVSLSHFSLPGLPVQNEKFVCFTPILKGDKQLLATRELMKELKNTYGATIINRPDRNLVLLKSTQAAVVHFATHSKGNEGEVALMLGGDHYLTALQDDLGRFRANLVVLNACGTQKGKFVAAEGLYNLPKLFIGNGCPAVISSLWDVDEGASAALFRSFYAHLQKGLNSAASLREGQVLFLKHPDYPEWANPYYWAGMTLTGLPAFISL